MPKKKKVVKVYNTKKKQDSESKIIEKLQSKYHAIDETKADKFTDLPLSPKTLKGLAENNYFNMTDIQRQSIGLAFRGNDILGAAKTGSGKTLAFLIPVLEILYCKRWTRLDGLGALIITPTRELAYQIYETLRKIGQYHDISAGLIIGGKDLKFEKKRMDQCNIVICTPGRLLQHMDENPLFDCVNMQVLVLDEADRCLDMGFEHTMNSIIDNLPPKRQSLLFSATQTKSVRDLARLSLKDPMYVSVHEHSTHTTPEGLQQSYVICALEDKMSMIWSFIRNHLKQKIIVFFSSCKQVKYVYEMFCRLRPGISLLALYGTLHQLRRMEIYETFCKKQFAVLFATDIAARGLDFPAVNWVVQMDCPEDVNAYIHRAGRTARFQRGGESLLVLLPSEEKMIEKLKERKIPISMIKINPNKLQSQQRKMEALLARDVSLKESAQRAIVTYVKSVFLMKDKEVFNVHALNTDSYARSLGLAIPPRIRFLQRIEQKQRSSTKNVGNEEQIITHNELENDINQEKTSDMSDDNDSMENVKTNTYQRTETNNFAFDDSDDDEILTVKRKNIDIDEVLPIVTADDKNLGTSKKKAITKAAVAKKVLKKKIVPNKKIAFDDEGKELLDPTKVKISEFARQYENEIDSGINIEIAKQILREEDKFDKQRFRQKIKERHKEEKRKLKATKRKLDEDKTKGQEDMEDSADNNASDSEYSEPDLSWLPDPDKIYGKQQESDKEISDITESEEDEEESKIHRPPTKKLLTQKEYNKIKKKQKTLVKVDNKHLQADEELALQLLQN
ncbi:probable ATP-dependent RNA helicase DDX10 isoform X2 [Colletes gigas]|uniref:probable ATP-dependent RNA helicase DDX10 isoform X2 n=1 Tax=Colletes gigas TaxID=935657 RepID=UPI001C9AE4D3|nr:probable ATP-dependent RNA helicase DDX10 isoform X2 [Colletes gigas]